MDVVTVDRIVDKYESKAAALLAILQDIQDEENYLPQDTLKRVAERLSVPQTRVYRMATFFTALSLEPRGKYVCNVCMGTACHVRGAHRLLDHMERTLDIGVGETTDDQLFTLNTVNCVGACALGPVVVVNKDYHGKMTNTRLTKMLKKYRKTAETKG